MISDGWPVAEFSADSHAPDSVVACRGVHANIKGYTDHRNAADKGTTVARSFHSSDATHTRDKEGKR